MHSAGRPAAPSALPGAALQDLAVNGDGSRPAKKSLGGGIAAQLLFEAQRYFLLALGRRESRQPRGQRHCPGRNNRFRLSLAFHLDKLATDSQRPGRLVARCPPRFGTAARHLTALVGLGKIDLRCLQRVALMDAEHLDVNFLAARKAKLVEHLANMAIAGDILEQDETA